MNDLNWFTWWPANTSVQDTTQGQAATFPYKAFTFQPHQKMFDAIGVRINADDLTINSRITLIPKHTDSVHIQWDLGYYAGINLTTRIQRYRQARTLRHHIKELQTRMKLFLEKTENVYGITIKKTLVKDTLLLSARKVFDSLPTTQNIYSLINKLKTYIQQQGAMETGYPMLNILRKDNTHFATMVAIPVNKAVKEQNDFVIKKMVPGNLLVAEVRGGEHTISNAFTQMENYLTDHHLESPAIPFYSLITDRIAETDTSKWVTRISYPFF
ncbi:GyrI-like domain-containing protein [Niastella caeni]|uniref:GyrI-like domain-containing protein n=1 Tax=Niastella caeni TaxID=2569763 RepID=A0A4S8HV39_9BACT|nr:GyrI-like domain-containing protein [Niastella caeni]THU37002.1 GyrI-like domain-containing protein [Niastella caeni]